MTQSEEPRSNLSVGMGWASRVTTVGLMFVVPTLLGLALDRWWGTSPAALLVATFLGFVVGMLSILRIAKEGTGGGPGRGGPRRG